MALLSQALEQAGAGQRHAVVLSGEPGIGKSRLVEVLKVHAAAPHTGLECRCSPYHQHGALYPVIELFPRALALARDDPPDAQVKRLEAALSSAHIDPPETVPLIAALLSLPLPARYAPLKMSPQRQRPQTLDTLLAILLALAPQPRCCSSSKTCTGSTPPRWSS